MHRPLPTLSQAGRYVLKSMTPEGSSMPLFFADPNEWGTVTRGAPAPHLLPEVELPGAGLTPETWFCNVEADPFVDPPHVRSCATVASSVTLSLPLLKELGRKHGTVKVMKAMQCLNVDAPLGQGIWEGKYTLVAET